MADYEVKTVGATTSSQKVIDAVNFDRTVSINPLGDNVFIGYDSMTGYAVPAFTYRETKFTLPEDKELWVATGSETINVSFLTSK